MSSLSLADRGPQANHRQIGPVLPSFSEDFYLPAEVSVEASEAVFPSLEMVTDELVTGATSVEAPLVSFDSGDVPYSVETSDASAAVEVGSADDYNVVNSGEDVVNYYDNEGIEIPFYDPDQYAASTLIDDPSLGSSHEASFANAIEGSSSYAVTGAGVTEIDVTEAVFTDTDFTEVAIAEDVVTEAAITKEAVTEAAVIEDSVTEGGIKPITGAGVSSLEGGVTFRSMHALPEVEYEYGVEVGRVSVGSPIHHSPLHPPHGFGSHQGSLPHPHFPHAIGISSFMPDPAAPRLGGLPGHTAPPVLDMAPPPSKLGGPLGHVPHNHTAPPFPASGYPTATTDAGESPGFDLPPLPAELLPPNPLPVPQLEMSAAPVGAGGLKSESESEPDSCGVKPFRYVGEPSGPVCSDKFNPVCGTDSRTYQNSCFARQAGIGVSSVGKCKKESGPEHSDSEDGSDVGTAHRSDHLHDGVHGHGTGKALLGPWAAKDGKIFVGAAASDRSGISDVCPDNLKCPADNPHFVCGTDGRTYHGCCEAHEVGVPVAHLGLCPRGSAEAAEAAKAGVVTNTLPEVEVPILPEVEVPLFQEEIYADVTTDSDVMAFMTDDVSGWSASYGELSEQANAFEEISFAFGCGDEDSFGVC